jgi:hypothetical protein
MAVIVTNVSVSIAKQLTEIAMKWYLSMLSDGTDENISSKRVVTLLAFMLCAIAFVANLFWNFDIKDSIFEGMMYIAIAGLGFTASERFSKQKDIEK